METPVFKEFINAYVGTQGYQLPNISVPLGLAKFFANVLGAFWKLLSLKGHPPLYPGLVNVLGLPFTVDCTKAIEKLNYKPIVTIEEGLQKMKL